MIKQIKENDIEKISELERLCFLDAWSKPMLTEEIKKDNSFFFGAVKNDELVGYILLNKCLDEAQILKICVLKEYRGQGIGKELIDFSVKNIPDLKIINLEVRKSNIPAIKLYESKGFEIVGERKKYYKNNEDAVLMTKLL